MSLHELKNLRSGDNSQETNKECFSSSYAHNHVVTGQKITLYTIELLFSSTCCTNCYYNSGCTFKLLILMVHAYNMPMTEYLLYDIVTSNNYEGTCPDGKYRLSTATVCVVVMQ